MTDEQNAPGANITYRVPEPHIKEEIDHEQL